MKGVLLDSGVIIEVLRRRDPVILDQWSDSEETVTAAIFGALTCLAIDAEIGRLAGKQMRRFAKSHQLDIADVLIGATALTHGLLLWTRNRKQYPHSGLRFYPPSVH